MPFFFALLRLLLPFAFVLQLPLLLPLLFTACFRFPNQPVSTAAAAVVVYAVVVAVVVVVVAVFLHARTRIGGAAHCRCCYCCCSFSCCSNPALLPSLMLILLCTQASFALLLLYPDFSQCLPPLLSLLQIVLPYIVPLVFSFFLASRLLSSLFYPQQPPGQAVVTGVVPSPPRYVPSIFIAHLRAFI